MFRPRGPMRRGENPTEARSSSQLEPKSKVSDDKG